VDVCLTLRNPKVDTNFLQDSDVPLQGVSSADDTCVAGILQAQPCAAEHIVVLLFPSYSSPNGCVLPLLAVHQRTSVYLSLRRLSRIVELFS